MSDFIHNMRELGLFPIEAPYIPRKSSTNRLGATAIEERYSKLERQVLELGRVLREPVIISFAKQEETELEKLLEGGLTVGPIEIIPTEVLEFQGKNLTIKELIIAARELDRWIFESTGSKRFRRLIRDGMPAQKLREALQELDDAGGQ